MANTGLRGLNSSSHLRLPGDRLRFPRLGSVYGVFSNRHTQPLKQVISYTQRIRDDRESRVHRSAGGEEAAVHNVKIVESCALQFTSSAEVLGSLPKRIVPFWCATPASGILCPTYKFRANSPWWHS